MQARSRRKGWILREHEWYCLDAPNRLSWLLEQLGLKWNAQIEQFLDPEQAKASPGYRAPRQSIREVNKWRDQLDKSDVERVQNTGRRFELPFYPDFRSDCFHEPT